VEKKQKSTSETLDNLGYRLTPQRMLVVRAIEDSQGHVGVDEIFAQVRARFPRVSLSTIYRTLDLLEQLGLVTKTDLGAGRVQYHRADDARHHHLVCQSCGHIVDLGEDELAPLWQELLERYGFEVRQRHVAIFGVCANCRNGNRSV
jgi:Fur family ferric uptake transcriptional regulator